MPQTGQSPTDIEPEFDSCDIYREWKVRAHNFITPWVISHDSYAISLCNLYKRYCYLARKNARIESVETSMRERHLLPSPIVSRSSTSTIISSTKGNFFIYSGLQLFISEQPNHRRFSIFNPLANQVRQSVIQLSTSLPNEELLPNKVFLYSCSIQVSSIDRTR